MTISYPDLSNLSNTTGIEGLLQLPNASYPFFWAIIIAGIWVILTFTMYFKEKAIQGRGNMLSSAAVSSLAAIMLSTLGSLLGIVTLTSQLPILIFGIVVIVLWIFSK